MTHNYFIGFLRKIADSYNIFSCYLDKDEYGMEIYRLFECNPCSYEYFSLGRLMDDYFRNSNGLHFIPLEGKQGLLELVLIQQEGESFVNVIYYDSSKELYNEALKSLGEERNTDYFEQFMIENT